MNACRDVTSEFVFFAYFMDEFVTLHILWIGLNSRSDIYISSLF